MVRAWFMDSEETDQRLEHHLNPPQFVDMKTLREKTGVEYFKVNFLFPPLIVHWTIVHRSGRSPSNGHGRGRVML